MKKRFKIFQTDNKVNIADKGGSSYEHDLFKPLDETNYNSEQDAEKALRKYLIDTDDESEFAILPVYSK